MSDHKRQRLLIAAKDFCDSFAQKRPLDEVLAHFAQSEDVSAFEHGLPQLAPFLGREFRGRDDLQKYFSLLAEHLSYENMRFSTYFADEEEMKVSVRGEARFTWTGTGQSWDEVFTYVLDLVEVDGDGMKVRTYEIWADSGAAYLASRGQLLQ